MHDSKSVVHLFSNQPHLHRKYVYSEISNKNYYDIVIMHTLISHVPDPKIVLTNAIKHLTALDAIIFPIIEPILNPILVFLIIGESMGPWAIIGGSMVLGGVTLRATLQQNRQTN
mgnify:CR=1 FL=1